jgi:hypothetical protein
MILLLCLFFHTIQGNPVPEQMAISTCIRACNGTMYCKNSICFPKITMSCGSQCNESSECYDHECIFCNASIICTSTPTPINQPQHNQANETNPYSMSMNQANIGILIILILLFCYCFLLVVVIARPRR